MKQPPRVILIALVVFASASAYAQSPVAETKTDRISDRASITKIELRFDQNMRLPSNSDIVVHGKKSGKRNGVFSGSDSAVLTFTPSRNFLPGEEIEVTVKPSAKSADDVAVARAYVLRYRVPSNAGPANFASTRSTEVISDAYDMAMGDLNGDGHLDMIAINAGRNQENVVYFNDGNGNYPEGAMLARQDNTWAIAVGDVDNDGHMDIIVGNGGDPNYALINNGSGGFSESRPFGTGADKTQAVALGDFDADGDLDIAVGNGDGSQNGHQNFVYINDGNGYFTEARPFGPTSPAQDTRSLAVGDIDNDGDLDIVTAHWSGHQNTIHLNDGAGNFLMDIPYGNRQDWSESAALGDADNDGDLDILVGTHSTQDNVIYINNGMGQFLTQRSLPNKMGATKKVEFGDMDGDGDMDVALVNVGHGTQGVELYLNDGSGDFQTKRQVGTRRASTKAAAIGDVDGDGVLDLIASERAVKVFLNTDSTALSMDFTPISAGEIEGPTNMQN